MIIPKSKWPKFLEEFSEIKGICYGECIWGTSSKFSSIANISGFAHAHCDMADPKYFGWICLKHKYMIKNPLLMAHEYAHIFVGHEHYHDDMWRRWCVKLGGTLEQYSLSPSKVVSSYFKKTRVEAI